MEGSVRRFLPLLLVAILLGIAPAAQADEPPVCQGKDLIAELEQTDKAGYERVKAEAAKLINAEAKLWRIEKGDLKPSFVFGTIASTDERVTHLVRRVEKAVLAADTILADVADGDEETYTQVIMSLGDQVMFERGDNMLMRLDYPDYVKLRAHMLKTGGSLDYIKGFKPWMFHDYLDVPLCEEIRSRAGLVSLPAAVLQMARQASKKVADIEPMEAGLRREAAQPFDLQLAELTVGIDGIEWLDDWQETLVRAYIDNRLGEYVAYIHWVNEDNPLAKAVFDYNTVELQALSARTRNQALPLLDKGGAFILVYAYDLSGDKGLVALFREAGYTVTPVE